MLEDDKQGTAETSIRTCGQAADTSRDNSRIVIDAGELFAGRREVDIRHAGQVYRLRITRNGKLILNK